MTMVRMAIAAALLCAAAARAHAPESKPQFCPVEGDVAVAEAAHKGYEFTATHAGDTHCRVDGASLTVSATADEDGACTFTLFVPPPGDGAGADPKPQVIIRVELKLEPDGPTVWVLRKNAELKRTLTATKGTTDQYRIVHVELPPVGDACEPQETIWSQL